MAWVIDFKQKNPNAPQSFVEVGHLDDESGAEARWTMRPMLAADLISALSRALAETLAVEARTGRQG